MDAVVEPHPSPSLKRLFRRRTGLVPPVVSHVAPHAWAYRPFLFLMNPDLKALDADLSARICFVVARDNTCRFCYGRFRSFLRVAGYSSATLDRLEEELSLSGENGPKREALKFAVALSQGRLQQGASTDALRRAGYGDVAIREITGIAATATLINRVATMLAVPLNEAPAPLTGQWYFDVLQPVLRALLHGWQRFGAPRTPPLAAEEVKGPFAPWIEPLQGTCVGRLLHTIVTEWRQDNSALPLQTKLFVLAVVARGLHADKLEARARRLLATCCDVSERSFNAVVDHLRGEAVSDRAAALLQLARESIRYEAGRIQPLVRKHTQDLSRGETIDAVATLGLSNALARLRALAFPNA